MTSSEKRLLAQLLRSASDRFSNHGCNDLNQKELECLTKEEWVILDKKMQIWNQTPEEHDPEHLHLSQTDWTLMCYFSDVLEKEVKG